MLELLFTHPVYRRPNFYGETCVHNVYGLNRLSKDRDLDNSNAVALTSLASDLLAFFQNTFGYAEVTAKSQQGEMGIPRTTLKFPILYALKLASYSNETLHLKVEISSLRPLTRLEARLPRSVSRAFAWILDALTGPFNWINELGARAQGRVMTRARIGALFDGVHARLVKKVAAIQPDEWDRGMDYPAKWDPNFQEYMTLKDLFRYCVQHFDLHYQQVAYSTNPQQKKDRPMDGAP